MYGLRLVCRMAPNSLKALVRGTTGIELAYKVADANVGVGEDGIVTIPHYMVMYI